jgi:hypothetical protein
MKKIILFAACIFVLSGIAVAQNKSIYTSTKSSACRTIESSTEGDGSYEAECNGTGGYKVHLLEGDIRQTLNIITPAKKTFELNFWYYYSGFSSIGEKIEWRTKAGVPVALIARFNVSNSDNEKKSTSYLMISKIGKKESCVTDVVLPGPKQNETARILADAASTKPCKATGN